MLDQARLLAKPAFGGLDGEGVDRTAPVVVEEDAPPEVLVEHRAGRLSVDPSVVEPFGEAHEVAREPVSPDVRRLPGPLGLELVAQSLEERAAVPRAARIVLPVGADEEEWVLDLGAGSKLEATQVLVRLELGSGHSRLAGPRGGGEREELRVPPAVRSPDEQQPPVRYRRNLLA